MVVFDPKGGYYFWRHSEQSSSSDVGWLREFKSGHTGIYIAPDAMVEFAGGSNIIEHKTRAASMANAESASIAEVGRNVLASQRIRDRLGVKIVPFIDAPPLVGFENYPGRTKRLPGFQPIPPGFVCADCGGPGQGRCPHGTLVLSISKQGDNWRLVLRNRWDVEIILDPSFNAVSSKQLTMPPKREWPPEE